jgi:hypothetical protein
MRTSVTFTLFLTTALILLPQSSQGWGNGQSGNAQTDEASECSSPPYSTHDWIADHALALLPTEERAWLEPHKTLYLLGTEAPDNNDIPDACNGPNNGYDDRRRGHSITWNENFTEMINDRPARRAKEEYDKAVMAFEEGDSQAAAFYLGAAAHYIGDVSQYGHSVPDEQVHSPYEGWVGRRTDKFDDGVFESYIELDRLVRRTPYTATKRISRVTAKGQGKILSAAEMDSLYSEKAGNQKYLDSIGHSLNYGVNALADVLHTFYLHMVAEEE